jgi:hypothetical protein
MDVGRFLIQVLMPMVMVMVMVVVVVVVVVMVMVCPMSMMMSWLVDSLFSFSMAALMITKLKSI